MCSRRTSAASEAALPHLVEQLRGMADGAEQPFSLLMAANAFEEIYGQVELGDGHPASRSSDAPTWWSTALTGRSWITPRTRSPATSTSSD